MDKFDYFLHICILNKINTFPNKPTPRQMNKIKLSIASFIMLSAVALVGCGPKAGSATATSTDSTAAVATAQADPSIEYNGKIVYIVVDSLMRGYNYAIDLRGTFEEKSTKAQTELNNKARSLEREARDYQEKAQKGILTRSEAQTIETGLQQKEQSLMQFRDKMMQELTEEEAVTMNKISNAILEYVTKYNNDKKYSMIISSTGANTVLIADPSLNITADLLSGLNEEYAKTKPAAAAKTDVAKK